MEKTLLLKWPLDRKIDYGPYEGNTLSHILNKDVYYFYWLVEEVGEQINSYGRTKMEQKMLMEEDFLNKYQVWKNSWRDEGIANSEWVYKYDMNNNFLLRPDPNNS